MRKALVAGGCMLATAIAVPVAVESANADPTTFVGLNNPPQAEAVVQMFGVRGLWAFGKNKRLQPLSKFKPFDTRHTLFTTLSDAERALGDTTAKTLSLVPSWRVPGGGRRPTTTYTPPPTTATAGESTPSPAASSTPTTTTPSNSSNGLGNASVSTNAIFADSFSGLGNWNTFITSNAAGGWPWNSNDAGGSSADNPSVQNDAEYFLPGQASTSSSGLVLSASEQPTEGVLGNLPQQYSWRSGVVSSYNHFQFDGGMLQITAKMPSGDGLWPGLFLLPGPGGNDGDNAEIDLFEGGYTGAGNPNDAFAWHLHTSSGVVGGTVDTGTDLTAGFNTYGLDWVPGQSITWYLNGQQIAHVTSAQTQIPDEPMEIIIDLQVASSATGSWHTLVDSSTPTNASMEVSNVQVTAP